jgi:gentisate 1,2-dioxygenase
MRGFIALTLLTMVTLPALAGTKDTGTTTLKDLQPAGTTDKNHKHQQYDLSFVSSTGKDYTCRTSEKKSVKATDFVVGSNLNFQVDGNKGKVKTSAGKELSCTIVRVANVTATPK